MKVNKEGANKSVINGLSEVLRDRRGQLGLSQSELAKRAGLHRTYVSEVERATHNMTLDTLTKLADALQTTVLSLLESADQLAKSRCRPLQILLVEDNEADAHLVKRSLEQINRVTNLTIVDDGAKAMEFVNRTNEFAEAPAPDLILLDLNLPKKDGYEVLAEIKSNEDIKRIPVVILTTSSSEQDIARSYGLQANCLITKPSSQKEFQAAIAKI